MKQTPDFRFFMPLSLEKGRNERGEEVMKFKGKASDGSKDSQGEYLNPNKFDLTEFDIVNWNHLKTPDAILGYPTKKEVKDGELFIEGELYNEMPMAKSTWQLMKAFKKRGKSMGLSVEGKVLERDPFDESKIVRAKITGVALTPNPINGNTFAEIIEKGWNGVSDWEFDEETSEIIKSFETESLDEYIKKWGEWSKDGIEPSEKNILEFFQNNFEDQKDDEELRKNVLTALISKSITAEVEGKVVGRESVEHDNDGRKVLKKIEKSDVYDRIYSYFYPVNSKIAKSIYSLIEKTSDMKKITEENISKAFEILEKASKTNPLEKEEGGEREDESESEPAEEFEGFDKGKIKKALDTYKDAEDVKKAMVDDGYSEKFASACSSFSLQEANANKDGGDVKELKKALSGIGTLSKSFNNLVGENNTKFSALSEIYKSHDAKVENLCKAVGEIQDFLNTELKDAVDKINKIANAPQPRKSINGLPLERFEKGGERGEGFSLSSKSDMKNLSNKLWDMSGIEKGEKVDEDLVKICTGIEQTGTIEKSAVSKIMSLGIQLVQ